MSGLFVYSAQWGQIFYEIIFESVSHSSANFWIFNCGYKKVESVYYLKQKYLKYEVLLPLCTSLDTNSTTSFFGYRTVV